MDTLTADMESVVFAARRAAHEHELPKAARLAAPSLLAISRPRFVHRLASERGGGGQIPDAKSCLRSRLSSCAKGALWKQLRARHPQRAAEGMLFDTQPTNERTVGSK